MADIKRLEWKGRFEFLFTTFGFTIGLGNVWRFPERCYRNGGGAFLFPYLLTVVLCTVPMVFLEMCLGQFSSQGPVKIWKMSPIFAGLGWAMWLEVFIISIYYITPLMYSIYYMLVSFVNIGGTLPWQQCGPNDGWGTEKCISGNTSAEEEYWNRFVLEMHESEGMHDLGAVVLRNICLLMVTWVIVYYCCIRGIRSIAKVIYVTATFPFGIIVVLLIRGVSLSGHEEGIKYYLKSDWSALSDMNIWASAANQAFYSLGPAFGCHYALSSHNRFKNNICRDAIIIGVANTLTSFLLGLVVFSFLGHASETLNIPVENMIDHGPGLLFISYIQGLTQLPESPIWCVLFFLMVFTLGLDSLFVQVWFNVTCIDEIFPNLNKRYKHTVLLGICVTMFLLGIPLVTKGGIHMIVLMDRYVADIGLATLMICESVIVCWVYGIDNFIRDVEMMIGHKSKYFWWYWKATWMVAAPLLGVFTIIASCVGYKPSSYRGKVIPPGGEAIGWLIILAPLVILGVFVVIQIRRYKGIKAAIFTSDEWGPQSPDAIIERNIHINTRTWQRQTGHHNDGDFNIESERKTQREGIDCSSDDTFDVPSDDVIELPKTHHIEKLNDLCPVKTSEVSTPNTCMEHPSDSWTTGSSNFGLSSEATLTLNGGVNECQPAEPPPACHIFSSDAHSFPDKDYITPINYDVECSDNSIGDGYITPVAKRQAPPIPVQPTIPVPLTIPVPPACNST